MICLILEIPGSLWFLVAVCVLEVVSAIEIAARAWPVLRLGLFPNHEGKVAMLRADDRR